VGPLQLSFALKPVVTPLPEDYGEAAGPSLSYNFVPYFGIVT